MKIFLITDMHYGKNTNYERFGGLEYINQFGEHIQNFVVKKILFYIKKLSNSYEQKN